MKRQNLPPGVTHDPSATGYDRYTHKATGRAIVRQPYMSDTQWEDALTLWVAGYSVPTRFRSVAIWPRDSVERISLGNTVNRSDDWDASEEHAAAICRRLNREGFGGNRRTRPLRTWVEEVDAAGNVVAVTFLSPIRFPEGCDVEEVTEQTTPPEIVLPVLDSDACGEWRADSKP